VHVLDLDRVLVATPALDRSVETFEEYLGLSFGDRIAPTDDPVTNRMSAVGVEFVTGEADSAVATFLDEHGPGLYAIALEVADLEAAGEHLADRDVDPIHETRMGSFRELFYHPADFEGTLLVLTEYDHRHPAEIASTGGGTAGED
jgi:4-hydroxyphenylpyruvate dioxygenase-like putative hemolysin